MLAERTDPVMWSQGNPSGPLTQAQLDTFCSDGFLFFPGLLANQEPALLAECIREADALQKHPNRESFIFEEDNKTTRTIYNAHALSETYARAIRVPFIVDSARQLLGSDVYLHQSHLNYKKAFFGKNFFWHQDWTFWHHEDGMPRMRSLAVILFLDDVSPENGPMMMIPGSHMWYSPRPWTRKKRDPNEAARHNLVDEIEENGLLTPEQVTFLAKGKTLFSALGPSGSILMYEGNTAHASADNLSPRDRAIALFFYNSIENNLLNPSRPHYIAERVPKIL